LPGAIILLRLYFLRGWTAGASFFMHNDKPHKEYSLNRCSHKLIPRSIDGTVYLQFLSFSDYDYLTHGIFTRIGGVSKPPYDTLNASYNTGDRPDRVKENLRIIQGAIGARRLIFMNQVHGGDIVILRMHEYPLTESTANADALITDIPSVALMVKQADCQGVILYDPVKAVLAVVHCGWRGNVRDILGAVVNRMRTDLGCRESDILAAVGPSLGPCCAEFTSYREIFPEWFREFIVRRDHFNLWEISRRQLLDAGLAENRIEIAGICTRCNTEIFYSYRGEGITGRFATVAMLREKL
jgi:YfiH family protein